MGRARDLFERIEREGEAFIDELITTRKAEEAFLDFKRSKRDGASPHLEDEDRRNLATALSGFANSDGGVIIWGVGASQSTGDVADSKHLIQDPQRFASQIENAVSGCTVPPVPSVRSIAVRAQVSGGYVATLIPQSVDAPHQVVGKGVYYIRAGSTFQPATHGVLAGMFGRHPQPQIVPQLIVHPLSAHRTLIDGRDRVGFHLSFQPFLLNSGAVVASDAYMSLFVRSVPNGTCRVQTMVGANEGWLTSGLTPRDQSFLLDRKLPPRGRSAVATFHVGPLYTPFADPLDIELVGGCHGIPPIRVSFHCDPGEAQRICEHAAEVFEDRRASAVHDWHADAARLLGNVPHWLVKGREGGLG